MGAMKTSPYGSWKSPLSAELVARGSKIPSELTLDGDRLYWLELRPEERGRYALCTLLDGRPTEVLGKRFNVRTRVHEYGGGSYLVDGSVVYFVNFGDQLLYVKEDGAAPRPLTPQGLRFADFVADGKRSRLVGISEDHRREGQTVNAVSEILKDGSVRALVSGNDFYSSPKLNRGQTRLAWLTWSHPNMPWDGTELWVAELGSDGVPRDGTLIAGGKDESVFQPEWSPDGTLYFVSDRSGWWNIHRWKDGRVERVVPMAAEFGRPQWGFRMSTYALESEDRVVCSFLKEGRWSLAKLDTESKKLKRLRIPFTDVSSVRAAGGRVLFIGASPADSGAVASVNLRTGSTSVLYRPEGPRIDGGFISRPQHVAFATAGGKKAYAFFYPPKNKDYAAPRKERPPLVVVSHGGPTSFASEALSLGIQYWTSRGFAVLNVNYRGSTGYGREYMKELEGNWGIVDTDDCANGALALVRRRKVDPKRLIIRGGSAGGFTTLCALTFKRVFAAGASYYGVSDLEGLEKETHKFESHYSDRLVAPYPEERDVYTERSPVNHTDRLSTPIIFFQGSEDVIVLPNQSERMAEALRVKGVPVAYIAFEGEQHGFRKAESLVRAYGAELYFYSKVLKIPIADRVAPVEIENLR